MSAFCAYIGESSKLMKRKKNFTRISNKKGRLATLNMCWYGMAEKRCAHSKVECVNLSFLSTTRSQVNAENEIQICNAPKYFSQNL